MNNSKELMKMRKTNSSKAINHQKDTDIYHGEKKPLVNAPGIFNSGHKMNNMNNAAQSLVYNPPENNLTISASSNYVSKKTNESVNVNSKTALNISMEEDSTNNKQEQNLQPPQKADEYIPLNNRINLSKLNMQEQIGNTVEINPHNKSLEDLNDESYAKKRTTSVSKYWEPDSNLVENLMGGSLGSTIVLKTNNCSGFNETFENLLGENVSARGHGEEKKFIGDANPTNNSKNYDLPMA